MGIYRTASQTWHRNMISQIATGFKLCSTGKTSRSNLEWTTCGATFHTVQLWWLNLAWKKWPSWAFEAKTMIVTYEPVRVTHDRSCSIELFRLSVVKMSLPRTNISLRITARCFIKCWGDKFWARSTLITLDYPIRYPLYWVLHEEYDGSIFEAVLQSLRTQIR